VISHPHWCIYHLPAGWAVIRFGAVPSTRRFSGQFLKYCITQPPGPLRKMQIFGIFGVKVWHLTRRAEIARELQTWKILVQTKPAFCHIRPCTNCRWSSSSQKTARGLLANVSSSSRETTAWNQVVTQLSIPSTTELSHNGHPVDGVALVGDGFTVAPNKLDQFSSPSLGSHRV
jgi:hypothetical protein